MVVYVCGLTALFLSPLLSPPPFLPSAGLPSPFSAPLLSSPLLSSLSLSLSLSFPLSVSFYSFFLSCRSFVFFPEHYRVSARAAGPLLLSVAAVWSRFLTSLLSLVPGICLCFRVAAVLSPAAAVWILPTVLRLLQSRGFVLDAYFLGGPGLLLGACLGAWVPCHSTCAILQNMGMCSFLKQQSFRLNI